MFVGWFEPLNDTASLPRTSWTAALDVPEFEVGAVYATVNFSVVETVGERVRITVLPLTETPVTVAMLLPLYTVNALAEGATEPNASLNVSVACEPAPFKDTVLNVGGAMSGPAVELFVTAVVESVTASLPAESWIAEFDAPVLEVGAVYATVTV